MITKIKIWIALMTAILASGCSTGVQKTNFHSDYSRLHQGKYIKGFWAAPELDRHTVAQVSLEPIDTSRMELQEKVPVTNAVFWLKNSIEDHLKTEPPCGLATQPSEST